jgi:hypothetical protein
VLFPFEQETARLSEVPPGWTSTVSVYPPAFLARVCEKVGPTPLPAPFVVVQL